MANTYVAIQTITVGSGGQANIEFTSIPATYTDLQILLCPRTDTGFNSRSLTMQFNGSTSGYSDRRILGSGSTTSSDSNVYGTDEIYIGESAGETSTFSNIFIYIPNYTSSNNKSVSIDTVQEYNSTTAYAQLVAGLWSNTAAITSIKFINIQGGNFAQYSTATLYGIKKD
jgi:hypothetical protein